MRNEPVQRWLAAEAAPGAPLRSSAKAAVAGWDTAMIRAGRLEWRTRERDRESNAQTSQALILLATICLLVPGLRGDTSRGAAQFVRNLRTPRHSSGVCLDAWRNGGE